MHEAFEKGFCSHVLYLSFFPVIGVYFGSVWQLLLVAEAQTHANLVSTILLTTAM